MNDPINIKAIISFREPDDYSIEEPKVIIDGEEYTLFEGGNLMSNCTPKVLAQTIEMLRNGRSRNL